MCTAPLLTLSLCPIYGNEPSALSVTAAQIDGRLGGKGRCVRGGWVGISDRQESETKTLILLCLPLRLQMPSDVEWESRQHVRRVFKRGCDVKKRGYLKQGLKHRLSKCTLLRKLHSETERVLPPAGWLSCSTKRAFVKPAQGWPISDHTCTQCWPTRWTLH